MTVSVHMQPTKKRLGQLLREQGVVDGVQLQSALAYQRKWGVPLGQVVVDLRFCTPWQVLAALSVQTGVPALDLDAQSVDPRLAGLLPRRLAEMHRVVPLKVDGPRDMVLEVAIAAPADLHSLDAVRSVARKARVVPRLATDVAITRAIERLYQSPEEAPRRPEREPILLPEVEVDLGGLLESEARSFQTLPDLSPQREVLQLPLLEPLELEELEELLALPDEPPQVLLYGWGASVTSALTNLLGQDGLRAGAATTEQVLEADESAVVLAPLPVLEAMEQLPRAQLLVAGKVPEHDVVRAQALGARGFLAAPLDTELMLRAVRRLTGEFVPWRAAAC